MSLVFRDFQPKSSPRYHAITDPPPTHKPRGPSPPVASGYVRAADRITSCVSQVAVCLAQYNATLRTVDLRNQRWSGTDRDWKVESDCAKHSTHAIGIRVLGEKPHQYRALWCGQGRIGRLLPVYEERYDSVGDDAARVGELPRQKRAAGLLSAAA